MNKETLALTVIGSIVDVVKRKQVFGICLITVLLFSAWSNADLLATHSFTNIGTQTGHITDTVTFTFTTSIIGDPVNYDHILAWEAISVQDVGKTFYLTADMDPDFALVEERLTNGTPDTMVYSIFWPNLDGSGVGTGKSDTRLNEGVDLVGYDLASISLTINELTLNSPDDYSWDVTWGFWNEPIPEPATVSLLALGGLALLRKRN